MNPVNWNRQHKIALVIVGLVGASLGVVLGYIVYALSESHRGAMRFDIWIQHPVRTSATWWGLYGAITAMAWVCVRRFLSR